MNHNSAARASSINLVFFGTPDFARIHLERLLTHPQVSVKAVVTQPDRPAGRGGKLQASPCKTLAVLHSIPVLQPESIRRAKSNFVAELTQLGPFDLGVVVAFGQILPQAILNVPMRGCINVHASILPRWRGAAPIQRAILAGDTTSGVSLMQMDAGLDTGPVYVTASMTIAETDDFGVIHDKLGKLGADLLYDNLSDLAAGLLNPSPQALTGVTYAAKITNSEAEIDWSQPAQTVVRQINGLSPFPGAYTTILDKRLKIFKAAAKKSSLGSYPGQAGQIVFIDNNNLEVTCGSGVISILEAQMQDRKRLTIQEFIKGQKLELGMKLGPI